MKEVYDIETLKNCHTYCSLNPKTLERYEFVIHQDQNDFTIYLAHLKTLTGQIGFNNISFDGQVIQFILNNQNRFSELTWLGDGETIASEIYQFAQATIEVTNKGGFPKYPEWKLFIPQLDLFKIFHFDNKAKMTSLKWIEYMIDMNDIQEMPIHHSENVTIEQVKDLIIPYNHHDVTATYKLYLISKGETEDPLYKGVDKIELRMNIQSEFGIKCLNYNDVRIGDEINKLSYCKLLGITKKELPPPDKDLYLNEKYLFKECFPLYMKFKTIKFQNFVENLGKIEVNLNKKQIFKFEHNGTIYTIAKGGIHSEDKPRIIKPNDNEYLRDADIGSQYPNAIRKRRLAPRHLGVKWLEGYVDIIYKRLEAKGKYKATKIRKYNAIQEAYKLSLNGGGYGKLGEEYNWQFDPKQMMYVTIGNQVEILMLIEDLELNGIHVLSANTDGIVCLFDKSLDELYYKICKDWEVLVGNDTLGQLEYVDYSALIQTSVNDYIAVKTNGDFKCKGDFTSEFELHKNKVTKIVPIALQEYFINNVPIKNTILSATNIYDFCLGAKSIGKNKLISFNKEKQIEIPLQKINRYYISNGGIYLLKRLPMLENKTASMQIDIFGDIDDGTRESRVEANSLQTIFNTYLEKSMDNYDINYNYYIEKCNKIINKIMKT